MLMIVHNNRAYHQEVMHIQRMANRHNRGIDRAGIGTTIADPNIDYAKLAEAMGVRGRPDQRSQGAGTGHQDGTGHGPEGRPVLLDVISQPR